MGSINKICTPEELSIAINKSISWAEVCRNLDRNYRTGNQSHLKMRASALNIDFSHFLGKAHNLGKIFIKKDAKEYFFLGSKISSHHLKKRLIRDGYKKENCERCGISEWQGSPVVLELDHIDSNPNNNVIENLQILCPNCHALETKERRNHKKKKVIDARKVYKPRIKIRKVVRPDLNEILFNVRKNGFSKTGRMYGVSDNCIRKWIKWEVAGMVDRPVLETGAK